ncbi:MAG: HPr family phosphocarrier protein [Alicyclobacillaceae bacterium]|nr:HPr family phosphocarrier protein [Alicyclobacillaceae bacterium]
MEHLYSEVMSVARDLAPEQILQIVRIAAQYGAEIQFKKHFFEGEGPVGGLTREANAKSVLGMLSLNLQQGDSVEILTYGEDGLAARDAIIRFLQES